MAILTPDSLLLPSADWILVVSACRLASLNEDEPTMDAAPPVEAAADADAVAEVDVDAAALLAGADDEELLLDEQAVRASSAPAPTPIAVTNFLCTDNLLVAGWNCKRHAEITSRLVSGHIAVTFRLLCLA
jgi:hypothetical protein